MIPADLELNIDHKNTKTEYGFISIYGSFVQATFRVLGTLYMQWSPSQRYQTLIQFFLVSSGTAMGEGLVGLQPYHFFAGANF